MAPPSIDYAISSLFCAEDNESIFDEVENNYGDDFEICNNLTQNNLQIINKDLSFSGFSRVLQSDEYLSSIYIKEKHHFCGFDYLKRLKNGDLDLVARNLAVDWIEKVKSHYNFGPLCFYLSVNYLDRFLSTYELPKGKAWMMQLLAVACVSIAAKIDETDVPFSIDLQVCESKFIFEAKTIQRMELLVMSTLNWRLQSVTPFSFIDHFLYKLSGDQMPPTNSISQAIQLISCTIKGIELLEFKPSEIAAAVAICVIEEETQTLQLSNNAFPSFLTNHLEKVNISFMKSLLTLSMTWVLDIDCDWTDPSKLIRPGKSYPNLPNWTHA
ncbi:hypothetical protein RND81_01G220300 [Saponaria officinalis]|uniref:Cyclin-like domain-containing protein n=1 Tax=Saponaria officinalis TaxID=3572 RepID=A0AAW1N915_SAPOF